MELTLAEQLELEGYRKFFDSLVLQKYPDTVITRWTDEVEENDITFTEEQDKIYFDRLAEIEKEFEGTEMFKRYDELLDKEIAGGLDECLNIIKQQVIDEAAKKGRNVTMQDMDRLIEQERAKYKNFQQYLRDNNLLN